MIQVKPTHVFNAAGVTGRPNVDWCETHQVETIRSNVIGCLNLADVTNAHGIHMTYFGTGCIFSYDDVHKMGPGHQGFTESDAPNFTGSYYSLTKAMVENLLGAYANVLTLRVRMPIVADLLYPRNFVAKIIKYEKIIDIPNSMTVLDELIPYSVRMAERELTGIMNFTNPGAISHNEILELYKEYIDEEFSWTNFSVEEQAHVDDDVDQGVAHEEERPAGRDDAPDEAADDGGDDGAEQARVEELLEALGGVEGGGAGEDLRARAERGENDREVVR